MITMNNTTRIAMIAVLTALMATPLPGSEPHNSAGRRTLAFPAVAIRMQAAEQANGGEGKILYYQDPMHPWYKSDKPGIAPDCGMKLVPVYASDVGALPPGGVEISSA